ncbi:glycoside hydrolase family 20 protein [Sphingobacterium sp. SRCM116780]|uniref:glycoside hydrolase family 20 protein n=1 Tax=Sphingobacterium sp. SRCM116780 TaxID=2907623 RepID=UPI001F1D0DA1|nr:glycoside hydrolase family 20 protein [Sphingobacterium sp. SRCM116780]UIR55286.1 glycoside hydrolase family 20 protein [Sphingobacterium sp. SRCM116780]
MRKILFFSFIFFYSFSLFAQNNIIPMPQHVEVLNKGVFLLKGNLTIRKSVFGEQAQYLASQLETVLAAKVPVKKSGTIRFQKITHPTADEHDYYELKIDAKGVLIAASTESAAFYATQTLLQLVQENQAKGGIPYLEIKDFAKFGYRGAHLDVCRHFFTVDEVKQFLTYLSRYKMNKFHWHLTDDQGWRIEIKSHPKLTEIGAYRAITDDVKQNTALLKDGRYGGFYTQEQIKEVVAYAKKLQIEVIPEIEMPGHALAALAAYPELSCTGGPFQVGTTWGVMDDIFCPKEETFALLQDVIDEVVTLFPSHYIHIGGDEAPKTRWKSCAYCQALIKKQGLKDELELQSYFIKRMEKYINGKGKSIIGWDEILEGGLAPNATVMSWTGIEGAIHAAKTGHDAIMTPVSHMYFDYYQGNPQSEPLAFSAELRLNKVYAFNPIPKELTAQEAKHILGPQANMWTEYIPNFKQVQYMLFPRLLALSEVAWGTAKPEAYTSFENRVIHEFAYLDQQHIPYSKAIFELNSDYVFKEGKMYYKLSTSRDDGDIRYTTDGTIPNANSKSYQDLILIDKTMEIQAGDFAQDRLIGSVLKQNFVVSKSTGKTIQLVDKPSESYHANGAATLVDAIYGHSNYFKKNWLGFNGKDLVATIDLGEPTTFSAVELNTIDQKGSWIHFPKAVQVFVSKDNQTFSLVQEMGKQEIDRSNGKIKLKFDNQTAQFIKIEVQNAGTIPTGFVGAGSPAWLFVDELSVY